MQPQPPGEDLRGSGASVKRIEQPSSRRVRPRRPGCRAAALHRRHKLPLSTGCMRHRAHLARLAQRRRAVDADVKRAVVRTLERTHVCPAAHLVGVRARVSIRVRVSGQGEA